MNLVDAKQQLVVRVAQLLAMDVPHKQIAAACGLSESRISQLVATEDVQRKVQELLAERIDQIDTLNSGWDAVEEEALGTVLQSLRANPDPDFALRAASLANRATRRGGYGQQPIAGHSTASATINLKAVFVEKLQQMNVERQEIVRRHSDCNGADHRKKVNALPIAQTEALLQPKTQRDIADIFAGAVPA